MNELKHVGTGNGSSQGHNLALTSLYVPSSLDSGGARSCRVAAPMWWVWRDRIGKARHSSQFKNNHFAELCSGSEAGAYLRPIDSCITQRKAQGPSRTFWDESKEDEKEGRMRWMQTTLRSGCGGIESALAVLTRRGKRVQGYLAHKKLQPPKDHHRALGIGLL